MYCPNCGKLNPQEDKFCMYCGAQLIDNQNTPAQPVTRAVSLGEVRQNLTGGVQGVVGLARRYLAVTIAVLLVVLVLVVYVLLNGLVFSPKATVERYFDAMRSGDTQALYDCMDLPESDFTTYEAFCTMWENTDKPSLQNMTSYEITEARSGRASSGSVDPLALLISGADLDSYADGTEDDAGSSLVKNYQVSCHISGSDEIETIPVQLIGQPVMGGLFQEYKVLSDYTALNYSVIVPAGAAVTVDSIPLTGATTSEEGDVYLIPAIFRGDHTIAVESPLGGLTEDVIVEGYDGDAYTCSRIPYSDATRTALFEQGKTQLNSIMAAALSRQGWPADVTVTSDPDAAEDVANTFQRLQENLYDTDRGSGYTSFQFTEITDESGQNQDFSSADAYYSCAMEFQYNYTRRYVNWRDEVEMNNGSSYGSACLDYVYQDGAWQLCGLSVGY